MKTTLSFYAFSPSKQLTFTALFASLCLLGTLVISIPLPIGYFNVGDVFVLLAGWCLGPIYGCIAAGLGSALADIIAGFSLYAPFTFFIKAADAFLAYTIWALFTKRTHLKRLDGVFRFLSAWIGEVCMAAGYFLTETLLFGVSAAFGSVTGNLLQGGCCLILATAICALLRSVAAVKKLFPHLEKKE